MEPCLRREVLPPRVPAIDPSEAALQARAAITRSIWILVTITVVLEALSRFLELS